MPASDTLDSTNLDGIGSAVGDLLDGMAAHETTLEEDLADDAPADTVEDTDSATPQDDDDVETEEEAEVDPLASATPFDYVVDNQPRTYDGIKIATKDGQQYGHIPADKLAEVRQKLSRHDHYETANKQLYAKTQEFERLGGVKALESAHVETERYKTALTVFASYLDADNPEKLIALAYAVQNGDRSEFDRLAQQVKDQTTIAAYQARDSWGKKATQDTANASQAEQRGQITTASIQGSIQTHAAGFSSLTAKDIEAAQAHFARLGSAVVRPATPDEARVAGVQPGELIVDHPVIYDWLKDRNELRAEQARSAATSTSKGTENAARLKAATLSKKGAKVQPKRQPVPDEKDGMTWAQQKEHLMSGGYTVPDSE